MSSTTITSAKIPYKSIVWIGLSVAFGGSSALLDANADALPIQPGSWTLAVLPDTQDYTEFNLPHFTAQTQWLADHAVSHNIKYVLHEGDVTEHNTAEQWNRGLDSMSVLDGVVPYAIAPGNHDYGPSGFSANRNSFFNDPIYFGPSSPYANQSSVGGFFEAGKTDNSYHTFSAGDQDWLVVALEWGPRDEVVAWANQVVENHPDHLAMLVTHAYMYYDETRYDWDSKGSNQSWNPHSYPFANNAGETINDGQELWDKLVSQHENFRFTFSGHVLGDGTGFLSSVGQGGNIVHQMLANYQFKPQGGNGDMRLLEFLEDGETVIVRTYSPVLDRYDTTFDQEFTLKLSQLHDPLAPPIDQHAVAANLIVAGATAPADNSVGTVMVSQSSAPGVGTLQLNRGDYELSVGGNGLEYQRGVLLATVTQNMRDGIRASVEAGRNSFSDGLMALSVMQLGVSSGKEVNFNNSIAWFDFRAGWQGAHVNGDGTVQVHASQGVDQSMVTQTAPGRLKLDLGVNSLTDGLLFAIGSNNSNTVVQTAPASDGSGWDIRIQNNAADFSATGLSRDFSFVYLPYMTENLIGGLYDGETDSHLSSTGVFTMSRLATGEYELSIPGESPETGMLILTICDEYSDGIDTAPNDNLLSYEPSGSGTFLINSVDLPSITMEDSSFAWAFLSFEDPITPRAQLPADFDGDGDVDGSDFLMWQRTPGIGDLVDWQATYGNNGASLQRISVPEPASLIFCFLLTPITGVVRSLPVKNTLRENAHFFS